MVISEKEIEVRYAETDQMGVVYHANYLVWMEIGRTSLIADLGYTYASLEEIGILSPVLDIQVSYKKAVRYGETVKVRAWIEEYDGLRIKYGYEIVKQNGEIAATGYSLHTCVKKENFRPISIRKHLPEWHEVYEKAKKS